ncbi:MAG TPA: ABC transporter permease, partial [Acidimicrobiales bacterium]|nr:ABC transporter permease [Acidimicrobiales bacterium]
ATIGVYSLVFGVFLKFGRDIPGVQYGDLQSFPLYLFCAIILWSTFNRVAIGSMNSFSSTGSLLKKVYFPPAAPITAHALAQVKQTMLEGLIAMLVIAALGYFSWTFLLWPLIIPPIVVFSLGIGLVLSLANAYYKDVSYLMNILTMLLFYCTPILYSLERVGDAEFAGVKATTLLELNPLTHFVDASREMLYLGIVPSFTRWAALWVAALVSLLLGWAVFVRWSKDVSEVV